LHINVREDRALAYWSAMMGCATHEIEAAVGAVGSSVETVAEYIRDRKRDRTEGRGVLFSRPSSAGSSGRNASRLRFS
jgi:hypothetical protein